MERQRSEALPLGRNKLGKTGLEVSPLALAVQSVNSIASSSSLTAEDVERAFHEHGVNTFFVNPAFRVLCEGVRRLIRAGHRDRLTLISMASIPTGWTVGRAWTKCARELGVDCIDVYLLGWVRSRWYVEGKTWPAMLRLQREGKARALGFSCHDRPLATQLARELNVDVLMIRYNAAHRGAEQEIFEPLGEARPGIIAYTVTRWGTLLRPLPQAGFEEGLKAPECYRFALSHPAVDTTLCAAQSYAELAEDIAGVAQGPLPPQRLEQARAFGGALRASSRGGVGWMFQ